MNCAALAKVQGTLKKIGIQIPSGVQRVQILGNEMLWAASDTMRPNRLWGARKQGLAYMMIW